MGNGVIYILTNKLLNEFNPIEIDDTIGLSTDDFF